MIDTITKLENCSGTNYEYSILIPTWNNLAYLQLCLKSIRNNSYYRSQIIVIINEGKDGTTEWIEQQDDIDHIRFPTNVGICYALNLARSIVKSKFIVYLNDDMYVLPNWDLVLFNEIKLLGTKCFLLSATMIEPVFTGNKSVVVRDYGQDLIHFDEEKLLDEYTSIHKDDWSGSTWPPTVVHRDIWDLVGGYSIEFSPGLGSDPDFSRKLLEVGVRHFKGVGKSLVYHFVSKSTSRINGNNGRKTFFLKWNLTQGQFRDHYIRLGQPYAPLNPPDKMGYFDKIKNKFRKMFRT